MNRLPLAILATLSSATLLHQELVEADLQVEYNTGLTPDVKQELADLEAEYNTSLASNVLQELVQADLEVDYNTTPTTEV